MRWLLLAGLVAGCGSSEPVKVAETREQLGQKLFDDPRLSEPAGQACSDCHVATTAFADPEDERTSAGVIRDRFGIRNTPSAMYLKFAPALHERQGRMVGGLFWDGRASTLGEQAGFPLLNPLEMNNPDKATVVAKVKAHYARDFQRHYGTQVFDDTDTAFAAIGDAIGAFERTDIFSPFSSRYDRYLKGAATLSDDEQRGLAIFEDPARGNCVRCHPSRPGADGSPPLFTNFAYEDMKIPVYRDNPFYSLPRSLNPQGDAYVDRGLFDATNNKEHIGLFRVPSLRNVARTTPYGHNGYFRRLDEMIEHIDQHDETINLSKRDIFDVVAFLQTLTDAEVEGAQ